MVVMQVFASKNFRDWRLTLRALAHLIAVLQTGTTDIPLTAEGERLISDLSSRAVGPGKLLDATTIGHVLISPRKRAQQTFDLLFPKSLPDNQRPQNVHVEEGVREWTYGAFEGRPATDINREREAGGEKEWDIWTEGCPEGESAEEMSSRADAVVQKVRQLHKASLANGDKAQDVLIVSHGHFSRCFVAKWLELPLSQGQLFTVDVGGITIGTYYHSLEQPCLGALNTGAV